MEDGNMKAYLIASKKLAMFPDLVNALDDLLEPSEDRYIRYDQIKIANEVLAKAKALEVKNGKG